MKAKSLGTLVLALVASLAASAPVFGHHGTAAFETEKKLTMKGTVTNWVWSNPHCILQFDAKDESGNTVRWTTELSNPSDMTNVGWTKQTLKIGDEITVVVFPVKNGKPIGRIYTVTLADGHTLANGFGSTPVPSKQ